MIFGEDMRYIERRLSRYLPKKKDETDPTWSIAAIQEEFPYINLSQFPQTVIAEFIQGLLPWERAVEPPSKVFNYEATVPERYRFLFKNQEKLWSTGASVVFWTAATLQNLNGFLADPERADYTLTLSELKQDVLHRAARIGVGLYEGAIPSEDYAEFVHLTREYRNGNKRKKRTEEETQNPYKWYEYFIEDNNPELVPVQLRELFDQFLRQRQIARLCYLRIKKKDFTQRHGKAQSPYKVLVHHLVDSFKILDVLLGGITPSKTTEELKRTVLEKISRRKLIQLFDETTQLLYDIYAAPAHRDLVIVDTRKEERPNSTTSELLKELVRYETKMAGYCQRMLETSVGRAKR